MLSRIRHKQCTSPRVSTVSNLNSPLNCCHNQPLNGGSLTVSQPANHCTPWQHLTYRDRLATCHVAQKGSAIESHQESPRRGCLSCGPGACLLNSALSARMQHATGQVPHAALLFGSILQHTSTCLFIVCRTTHGMHTSQGTLLVATPATP